MQAKVFDPFSEDLANDWLATTPVKVIYSASAFDAKLDGRDRQGVRVFYEEEVALGGVWMVGGEPTSARAVLLAAAARIRPSGRDA